MTYWIQGRKITLRCAVCGDAKTKPLVVGARHVTDSGKNVEFARCSACASLTCTDSISDFDQIQAGDIHTFLRQYLESTAGPWEMFWPPAVISDSETRSFLDIGCGFGLTVDIWKSAFGQDAAGCDPAHYAGVGRRLLGPHIQHGLLDDITELDERSFDVVYASEVIEHVDDPLAFIRMMKGRLTARGTLVLTTPAADYITPRGDAATVTAALAAGYHAFLLSKDALATLLSTVGLSHVLVEQHGERLIAWASMHPIARVEPQSVARHYIDYLRMAAGRFKGATDTTARSLYAGIVYRLFKERMLRGDLDGLDSVRQSLLSCQYDFLDHGQQGMHALRDAVSGLPSGAVSFGAVARYHLPQTAFLLGVYSQLVDADAVAARQWLELSMLCTEKLCAPAVVNNLEGAAFYWIALTRLVSYDIVEGHVEAASEKLVRMITSIRVPDERIGGGVARQSELAEILLACMRTLPMQGKTDVLFAIASCMSHARGDTPHDVHFAAHAMRHRAFIAFRDASGVAVEFAALSMHYATGDPDVPWKLAVYDDIRQAQRLYESALG